jgi:uncharacterized membrane protein YeaQ/YmgE (transglycosylase-associated protein family)
MKWEGARRLMLLILFVLIGSVAGLLGRTIVPAPGDDSYFWWAISGIAGAVAGGIFGWALAVEPQDVQTGSIMSAMIGAALAVFLHHVRTRQPLV